MNFSKSLASLIGGTGLSQIILIASTPILARLYSPEDFGAFGFLFSLFGIFALIVHGKFDSAINSNPYAWRNEKILFSGILVSFTFSLFFSLIFALVFLIYFDNFNLFWCVLSAFGIIFFSSTFDLLISYCISIGKVSNVAFAQAMKAIILVLGQFFLFYVSESYISLLISQFIAFLVASLFIIKFSDVNLQNARNLKFIHILSTVRRNIDYIKFSVPQVIFSSIGTFMPLLFINLYFGLEAVGVYWIANRILGLPSQVVSKSIRSLLQQKLLYVYSHENNFFVLKIIKSTILMFLIYLPICIVLYFYSSALFEVLIGDSWSNVGEIAFWLSVLWLGSFLNIPSVCSFPILNAQYKHLIFEIFSLILRLIVLFYFANEGDFLVTVKAYAITFLFINILLVVLSVSYAKGVMIK